MANLSNLSRGLAWIRCDLAATAAAKGINLDATALQRAAKYQGAVTAAATRWGVDPDLVMAVGYVESRFKQYAISSAGARGPFQFMPATWKAYVKIAELPAGSRPEDILPAAFACAAYLRRSMDKFGASDLDRVIASYNAGPGGASRAPEDWPQQTKKYVPAVRAALSKFRALRDACAGSSEVQSTGSPSVPSLPSRPGTSRPSRPSSPSPSVSSEPESGGGGLALIVAAVLLLGGGLGR